MGKLSLCNKFCNNFLSSGLWSGTTYIQSFMNTVLQFLLTALINIWTHRATQRKCIMSGYPQFSISSPQIFFNANLHIVHILKDLSLLLLIQLTNANTLPWELLYSPCLLSVYAQLGLPNIEYLVPMDTYHVWSTGAKWFFPGFVCCLEKYKEWLSKKKKMEVE